MRRKSQKHFFLGDNLSIKNLLIYLNNLVSNTMDLPINISNKSFEELKLLYEVTHPKISSHQQFYLEQLSDYYLLNEKIINELDKLINVKYYSSKIFEDLLGSTLTEHEFSLFRNKCKDILMDN